MRFLILLACLFTFEPVRGNPIALSHDIYIDREKLVVSLEAGFAVIEGRFEFKSAVLGKNDPRQDATVELSIPVWIPDRIRPWNDTATKSFDQVFSPSFYDFGKLSPEERHSWRECIGLEVLRNGTVLDSYGFSVSSIPSVFAYRRYKDPAEVRGFRHVLVEYSFEPILLKGTPDTVIRYRQPLKFDRSGQAAFVYMPLFYHLPGGQVTSDLSKYSMTVQDTQGAPLKVNGMLHPATSQPLQLPLKHRQIIKIERAARTK